jgi:hypothetical protein
MRREIMAQLYSPRCHGDSPINEGETNILLHKQSEKPSQARLPKRGKVKNVFIMCETFHLQLAMIIKIKVKVSLYLYIYRLKYFLMLKHVE